MVSYYRALRPERLVITGEGGAGKTVLAIELILKLLEGRDPAQPIPVRLSAAALDTRLSVETAVPQWITQHVRQTFQMPEPTITLLLAHGMLLPVIDGLDEMDATDTPAYDSRAAITIRACNAYLSGTRKACVVLTCRTSHYQDLAGTACEWLHDAAHVRVQPVDRTTAQTFLATRTAEPDRWPPVLDAIAPGQTGPLPDALSTPWRLTLAAFVYDQRNPRTGAYRRDPAELTDPALTTDAIRDLLLSQLIPAAADTYRSPIPAHRVHRWLAQLAAQPNSRTDPSGQPGRDLQLHQLWPLGGTRAPRVPAVLLVLLACGAAAATTIHVDGTFTATELAAIAAAACAGGYLARGAWTEFPEPTTTDLSPLLRRGSRRGFLTPPLPAKPNRRVPPERGPGRQAAEGRRLVGITSRRDPRRTRP